MKDPTTRRMADPVAPVPLHAATTQMVGLEQVRRSFAQNRKKPRRMRGMARLLAATIRR